MSGNLIIKPICAKLTRDTELIGTMDPYIKIHVGSQTHISNVHKKGGKNPAWNAVFNSHRTNEGLITFDIWEKDLLHRNEFIADGSYSLDKALLNGRSSEWVPCNYKGKVCGSVLIEVEYIPDQKSQNMGQQQPQQQMTTQHQQEKSHQKIQMQPNSQLPFQHGQGQQQQQGQHQQSQEQSHQQMQPQSNNQQPQQQVQGYLILPVQGQQQMPMQGFNEQQEKQEQQEKKDKRDMQEQQEKQERQERQDRQDKQDQQDKHVKQDMQDMQDKQDKQDKLNMLAQQAQQAQQVPQVWQIQQQVPLQGQFNQGLQPNKAQIPIQGLQNQPGHYPTIQYNATCIKCHGTGKNLKGSPCSSCYEHAGYCKKCFGTKTDVKTKSACKKCSI